jgi:hypothetical protein
MLECSLWDRLVRFSAMPNLASDVRLNWDQATPSNDTSTKRKRVILSQVVHSLALRAGIPSQSRGGINRTIS